MSNATELVLEQLKAHGSTMQARGNFRWVGTCPAHDDKRASLSIGQGKDAVIVKCFAGCSYDDVMHAIGLNPSDGFDNKKHSAYRYRDGERTVRTVYRMPGKQFRQDIQDDDVTPLYVPEGQRADYTGKTVWIPEGEKDAEYLMHYLPADSIAVTSPGGAAAWAKADYKPLKVAHRVFILADNDEPGMNRARGLYQRLKSYGLDVQVWQAADGHKDVTDHLLAGRGLSELEPVEMSETLDALADEPKSNGQNGRQLVVTRADQIKPRRQLFLDDEKVLPIGTLTSFVARGGEGKTALAFDYVAKVTTGTLPGIFEGQPRNVLIVAPEDDKAAQIAPRLIAAGANLANVGILEMRVNDSDGYTYTESPNLDADLQAIADAAENVNVALIVFDPVTASMIANLDKAKDVRRELGRLDQLAKQLEIAIICVQHVRKGSGGALADRASGSHAFRDVVRSSVQFATDEETGLHVATIDKDNYSGLKGYSWAFTLEPVTLEIDGEQLDTIKVQHKGRSDITVADILARDAGGERMSTLDTVSEWLKEYVGAGQRDRAEVLAAGKAEGFSEATLKRAIGLECHSERVGYGNGSVLTLKRNR